MKYETYELVAVQVMFQTQPHRPHPPRFVVDVSTTDLVVAVGSMDFFRRLSDGDAVVNLDTGVPFPTISVSCRICL